MSGKPDFTAVDYLTTEHNLPYTPFDIEEKDYLKYVAELSDRAWEDSYYFEEGKEKKCLSGVADMIHSYEKIFSGVEAAYRRQGGENSDSDTWRDFCRSFREGMSNCIRRDILTHFSIDPGDDVSCASVILSWNDHVLTFSPLEKEERLESDVSIAVRLCRTPSEIAYFSLLPVVKILGGTDSVEEALLRIEVSIGYYEREIEIRERKAESLYLELVSARGKNIKSTKRLQIEVTNKEIFNARLAITALKCCRKQVRDYFITGRRKVPLTKRILRDIITSFDWTYDVPGFLTRADIEAIYSYPGLVVNAAGDRAVYLSELRDISLLSEAGK